MLESVHKSVRLGVLPGVDTRKNIDACGSSVTGPDDLPPAMFAVPIDPQSFAFEKEPGDGSRAWSVSYGNPDSGDGSRISWSAAGWKFSISWMGGPLFECRGNPDLPLGEAFKLGSPKLYAAVEKRMKESEFGQTVLLTPGDVTKLYSHAPYGSLIDIVIPLESANVRQAVGLFFRGMVAGLCDGAFAGLHVCRCRCRRTGLASREDALAYASAVERQDGLPLAEKPVYKNGTVEFTRNALVLKLTTSHPVFLPAYRHFAPIIRLHEVTLQPFVISTFFAQALEGLNNREEPAFLQWSFSKECRYNHHPLPEVEPLDFIGEFEAAAPAGPLAAAPCHEGLAGHGTIRILAGGDEEFTPLKKDDETGLLDFFGKSGHMLAFWVNYIFHPYSPTFQVACMRFDDARPGKSGEIILFSLNPDEPEWKTAGTIRFSEDWDGSWAVLDAVELAGVFDEYSSRGEIAVASWLPLPVQVKLLRALEGGGDEAGDGSGDDEEGGGGAGAVSPERQQEVFSRAFDSWERWEHYVNMGEPGYFSSSNMSNFFHRMLCLDFFSLERKLP